MYARSVAFQLKPGRTTEFTQTLDKEVIPMLRKQKGFQDEIAFVGPNGTDAVGISLWDSKENAEEYARGSYASVLKSMEPVVEGTPQVQSYEVCNSTFHKITARVAV
jgi:heme-degrading monooxygenase HmoA